jgi:hypothetical protein
MILCVVLYGLSHINPTAVTFDFGQMSVHCCIQGFSTLVHIKEYFPPFTATFIFTL